MRPPRNSAALVALCVFTWAAVVPQLMRRGLDVVTMTYHRAAQALWNGWSPYADLGVGADKFKYGPAFAFLYAPLSQLGARSEALAWAALNVIFFWCGMWCWRDSSPGASTAGTPERASFARRTNVATWTGLILAAMELDGSLRYQQTNALMVGLCLLGVAAYRRGQLGRAGLWLAVAANFKVLPLAFAAALGLRGSARYLLAFALSSLALILVPAFATGWDLNLARHLEWLRVLAADARPGTGLLDLGTVLRASGWSWWPSELLRGAVALISVIVLCGVAWRTRRATQRMPWALWLCVGFCFLLLYSPRTESPTFVLLGPVYLVLAQTVAQIEERRARRAAIAVFIVAAFLVTLSFNDLWPRVLWNPHNFHYRSKTLGTLVLWLLSLALLWRERGALEKGKTSRRAVATGV